jgi:hypothetical protein
VKAPLAVCAIITAAVAVAGLAVFGFDDASTLVPPPEAVAEGFVRALATRRYEQALPFLADPPPGIAQELRRRGHAIERAIGPVHDVRGEPGQRAGATASAAVLLRGERGEARLRFDLVRRHGEWRLASPGTRDVGAAGGRFLGPEDRDGVGRQVQRVFLRGADVGFGGEDEPA